jgi:hypothetical protein
VVKNIHAIADPRKIRVLRAQLHDRDSTLPGR